MSALTPTKPAGTTPRGVSGEQAASRWVRDMFGRVAGRYDLLNHLLSFNLDKRWRAKAVDRLAPLLAKPDAVVLDLCCGTADVLLEMQARSGRSQILGSDFCHPMLVEAGHKLAARSLTNPLFEADALALPLRDGSLDLITCAFGFRNLANYEKGFQEILRVLKPGGAAAILEFSQPTNPVFGAAYSVFSTRILPWVGGILSNSRDGYSYLPESIRKFPGAEDLASAMRQAGFRRVEFERMTAGAVALHLGWK